MMGYPNVCAPQALANLALKAREDGFAPTPELRYRGEMIQPTSLPGGWATQLGWSTSYTGAVSVLQQRWVKDGEERWIDVPHA